MGQRVTYQGGFGETVLAEVIETYRNGNALVRPLCFIENGRRVELTAGQRRGFERKGGVVIGRDMRQERAA